MAEVENSPSKIFAQSLAVRVGMAVLLGYAVITGFAVYQKAHRTSIEHADSSNAVGDKKFFTLPQASNTSMTLPASPLVNFEGHSLYGIDQVAIADAFMARAGMDDSNAYPIYKIAGVEGREALFFYLKIGLNSYLKTERR